MGVIIEVPVYEVGKPVTYKEIRVGGTMNQYLGKLGETTQSTGTQAPSMALFSNIPQPEKPKPESSGGGGGYVASSSMGATEAFLVWVGRMPTAAEKAKMAAEGWTEDTIRRYAVTAGAGTRDSASMWNRAADRVRQLAAPWYGGDPSAVPADLVKSIISSGDYADESYLTNTYFPTLYGAGATNPNSTPFVQDWTEMTGRALTYTATQKLSEIVKAYGYTDVGRAAWQNWIKTTESAYTGNYGATKRAEITNAFNSLLGRNPTADELSQGSPYWEMATSAGQDALVETIMQSPEGRTLFANKPAGQSPTQYIADLKAKDAVFRWYYGDHVVLGNDGSISIFTGAPNLAHPTSPPAGVPDIPPYQAPTPQTAPVWKSLSNATFASELGKVGITVEGGKYMMNGQEVAYDNLLNYLPADTFYKDAQGYHYVQEAGAINPTTGAPAVVTRPAAAPAASTTPAASTQNPFANLGLKYITPEMAGALNEISADTLAQQFAWTEEAAYMQGIYGDILAETGMGGIDFYTVASGAKGSGAMRAKIMQAQNMYAFKEVYRDYYGKDPSPADYQTISSTFVSPSEFAHRMAAKESAKAKIDQVNELLGRTLDHQVTLADLENLAMGGQGSGELQSMIDQATRLDQFTDTLYQYKGHEPTADDYAEIAGYPSAAAFKWEITVNETMAEMGDEIKQTWLKANPENPLTDDQLRIMLGRSEGWGELQKQYNLAAEDEAEGETARKNAMNVDKIAPIYNVAEQGGFKTGLPGLSDIGEI